MIQRSRPIALPAGLHGRPALAPVRVMGEEGCRHRHRSSVVARLILIETGTVATVFAITGAALGLSLVAIFAGTLTTPMWIAATSAAAIGVVTSVLAPLIPITALNRTPVAVLLSEE